MNSQEFLMDYITGLEEEVFIHDREAKLLFNLIEEYRVRIENKTLLDEGYSFLDSLNMFEDVLDSKILTSN